MIDRSRPIIATMYRKNQPIARRCYSRIDRAMRNMTQVAMLEGEPRDVIEFAHAVTGLQIGTLKVGVNGLTANWVWDTVPQRLAA